ncbi:MAG TPA: hypothetical protein VFX97_09400 [Pyrinomonadaceae bacterium]|nr:hypothetical protein [Pyrinomonadaceae bacterium]
MSSDVAIFRKTFVSGVLSLAALAAVIGSLAYVAVTLLHPGGVGNDHPAIFRHYATSQTWVAIHLAQLAAIVAGLFGIAGLAASMLRLQSKGRVLALLALGLALAGIPIAAVLQAADGIALKRAVDVWVADGGIVGSASFAAARAIRWFEEGVNSILGLTMGWTVILAGAAMARGAVYPRWLGWIGVVIGIGVLIGAILVAETGFSPTAQVWVLARNPAFWIWTAVAGVLMWRRVRLLDAAAPTSPAGSDQ